MHLTLLAFCTLLTALLVSWLLRIVYSSHPCNSSPPHSKRREQSDLKNLLRPFNQHGNLSSIQRPIECYAPASGRLLGNVQPATTTLIDQAIHRASEAQANFESCSWSVRRRILRTIKRYILDNEALICELACLDSGKTRTDAMFGEVLATVEKLAWTIKHAERVLSADSRPSNVLMFYKHNEIRYEPLGLVAALVSWNYPFHNVMHPIISAIATSNGLILKPSERTAISAVVYVEYIVRRAITDVCPSQASLANLIQVVPCWPHEAEYLASHPKINHLTFIGSHEIAQKVASAAAKSLTPLTLELGGKDPAIVLDKTPDSDLARISSILMRGVFQAAGQNCIGIERIVIQPRHLEKLLEMLKPRVEALRVGDAMDHQDADEVDVGACISDERFDELEALVRDAVKQGANLHCGGERYSHPRHTQGHYFVPTLLSNVTPNMKIANVELFAPVMLIFSGEYTKSVDDVIDLANGTPYALGASVFGKHGSSDMKRVTRYVKAGMVCENDFASAYLCSVPFGGAPAVHHGDGSGYGRFSGPEGLRALCSLKSVNRDRFGGAIKTSIPPPLDYRRAGSQVSLKGTEARKFGFICGLAAFGFGDDWLESVRGLWGMWRNS